jgi:hypothetical protein
VASSSQARAVQNYRKRLSKRGLTRFEVLGLESDRELVRALAKRLAENDQAAAEIRASVQSKIVPDTSEKGGILRWLRNSPLMGVDLNLTRERVPPREIDL